MASSNPVKTDPVGDAQATRVQNHGQNVEQNTGLGASSAAQHNPSGDSVTNTSTSMKGSGLVQPGAGVDTSDILLKNPRKQDGAAHESSAGSLHSSGQGHKADF